jgi:hypothetical protein
MPARPPRFALDETQFRQLVAGQVLTFRANEIEVQCILSDIGWRRILRAVLDGLTAEPRVQKGPPDPPRAREFLPVSSQPRQRR